MSQPVNNEQFFHLTLGPVQGFVAQARRTRDFWAGSFLLSWMAGVAMHAVTAQKGKINFPAPDNGFLNAMHGNTSQGLPRQGSLPNRFKAIEAKVEAGFEPEKVTDALKAAWVALAEHIWQQDLEVPLRAMGDRQYRTTRAIWERQLASFWEVSWVLTADEANAQLLDRRKNWRNHWPAEEGGVTCMMMADQQELSGASGPDRKTLDAFWEPLRGDMQTDLREGEVLSTLAFIKRRFARHFAEFEWSLPAEPSFTLKGWQLPVSVPSVMHLAAWPWLQSMLQEAQTDDELRDALSNQLARGHDLLGDPEHDSLLPGLKQDFVQAGLRPDQAGVDPSIFFSSVLENPRRFADSEVEDSQRQKLLDGLAGIRRLGGKGEPAPFYTILLMDGDSLGSQLSEPAKQAPISEALNAFTKAVPDIVQDHHGFLVYAGGDDVLALLPVTTALTCAAELRQRYIGCFNEAAKEKGLTIPASLSGAALFCHIKRPLVSVLMDAHHVLDDIAKDTTGRDALAVRVWQPGGVHATWSVPWETALDNNAVVIEQLAATLREQDNARFTHGFLFRIKALGEQLGWLAEKDDAEAHNLLRQLVRAEMLHSGLELNTSFNSQALDKLIERLLRQARTTVRDFDAATGTATFATTPALMGDTFKVLRFLAREGHIDRDR
ncbi:type III-B CRISPR-associated protein Cas10/Cmr2 [Halomonas sp. GFAJ-1]|uniref:type III-B CRISPR-associated protein Cas10/Cmr2 n=1 Tax=Halomonas sp. GFAJ-1 TaxID=1118153 RepID=UPI00023A33C0|nr:type III-B CRISPR-associated protein Cas10/Cmr2 [Halomonas sp. GFAJ-1]AVI62971.1 type III-B CRISPR-associated protein Cas10/Cmr2 [Halomonas sp. GFAJ-1]EHK60276.1 CRISPR-associated protein, Crm2 family [Halomonas sp. GFAJ-1]